MALGLPIALAKAGLTRAWERAFWTSSAALLLATALLCGSRGGAVASAGGVALYSVVSRRANQRGRMSSFQGDDRSALPPQNRRVDVSGPLLIGVLLLVGFSLGAKD